MNTDTSVPTDGLPAAIEAEMKAKGYSPEKLADATGISYTTLWRCFRGLRSFTDKELPLVAAELGMTFTVSGDGWRVQT